MTAGNASGINDGAAALVVAGAERATRMGKMPMARVPGFATTAIDLMELTETRLRPNRPGVAIF